MTVLRLRTLTSIAAMALLTVSAAPVLAQSYPGGPEPGRDYSPEHDDRPLYDESDQGQSSEAYQGDQAYDESQYDQGQYDQGRDYRASSQDRRFDDAVDACADELTHGGKRVGTVDDVRRMGERYSVAGKLQDGRGYACSVDDAGHIRSVAVDGRAMM